MVNLLKTDDKSTRHLTFAILSVGTICFDKFCTRWERGRVGGHIHEILCTWWL